MRIFVLTSDKYVNVVPGFAYLFNRFWSDRIPVMVAHYKQRPAELPRNFSYMALGSDPGFSDGLIRFCKMIDDKHIILFLEDYFLTKVDRGMLDQLQALAESNPFIAKIDLTDDRLKVGHSEITLADLPLVKSHKNAPYHFSLQAAIWRRDFLLQFLEPGENPWETEKRASARVRGAYSDGSFDDLILGCQTPPVQYVNAVGGEGNKPGEFDWKKFPQWMKDDLKSEGLV